MELALWQSPVLHLELQRRYQATNIKWFNNENYDCTGKTVVLFHSIYLYVDVVQFAIRSHYVLIVMVMYTYALCTKRVARIAACQVYFDCRDTDLLDNSHSIIRMSKRLTYDVSCYYLYKGEVERALESG